MKLTLLCINCSVYNVNNVHNLKTWYVKKHHYNDYIHCVNMNFTDLHVLYNIIKSGIFVALFVHIHKHIKIQV